VTILDGSERQGRRRTESATENKPPAMARVKRWGKSPPRARQRVRHGKPHREQGRTAVDCPSRQRKRGETAGRPLDIGRRRTMQRDGSGAGYSRAQNPAYRLAPFFILQSDVWMFSRSFIAMPSCTIMIFRPLMAMFRSTATPGFAFDEKQCPALLVEKKD